MAIEDRSPVTMLYNLLFPLADEIGIFNLFRYITLRTGGAVVTALFVSFVLGPTVIRWLKRKTNECASFHSRINA